MGGWAGGKIISRIRLTSAKVLVEVEAEFGKIARLTLVAKGKNFLTRIWKLVSQVGNLILQVLTGHS